MTILTYVSSHGSNFRTGETYPDNVAKERTLEEVHNILKMGHTVEQRFEGGLRVELDLHEFEYHYKDYLAKDAAQGAGKSLKELEKAVKNNIAKEGK